MQSNDAYGSALRRQPMHVITDVVIAQPSMACGKTEQSNAEPYKTEQSTAILQLCPQSNAEPCNAMQRRANAKAKAEQQCKSAVHRREIQRQRFMCLLSLLLDPM